MIRGAALAVSLLLGIATARAEETAASRGEYLVHAAGCIACHTAPGGKPFAGGVALPTPFGTFHTPNITPDRATGIGAWSDADFLRALRQGISPAGAPYYPAFPYTSYTNITDADILAIKTFLFAQAPVAQANAPHRLRFPFSRRFLLRFWRALYFTPGPFRPAPGHDAAYDRGGYLVTALAHCGECHTPRNRLGAMRPEMFLAGTRDGPDHALVPNITPDKATGIGDWTADDVAEVLKSGDTPDMTKVRGTMREAVEDGLRYLTDADRAAIAGFVLAQKPIANDLSKRQ